MISRAFRVWYLIVLGLAVFFPKDSNATWQRVLNVVGRPFTSGFFFSELRGIVATVDNNVFYRTSDGGKTWVPAVSVPFTFPGAISQIFMTDTLRGWASVEEPPSLGHPRQQLWRTLDGGANWVVAAILDTGNFSCVYETSKSITVTSRSPRYNSLRSIDGGTSFQPGGFNVTNGVDFVDDDHGVITGFKQTPWKRTQDGGLTWQNIAPAVTEESWGLFAIKGTQTFYASPERDPTIRGNTGNSPVLRSTDFGATWQNMHTFPFFTTGQIGGGQGKLYVQVENISTNLPYTGFHRSDDGGLTWKAVGGPTRFQDERFVVTGCNGGVVYAFDDAGGVWKTRDGGDGTVIEPNPEPVFMGLPITFSSRICATTFARVRISNEYCDTLQLLDATFLDPNDDAVKSGAIVITNAGDFPNGIEGGGEDSIEFRWDPSQYIHTDTTVSFQVRIRYFSKALFTVRDTIITISAQAIGDEPTVSLTPTLIDFDTISFCAPKDTTFSLTNEGCDTLFILSANGSAPVEYQLLDASGAPLAYHVVVPPGQTFTYRVRLYLSNAGLYTSMISMRVRHQGKLKDTTISLRAIITSRGTYTATAILDFGQVSICAPKDSFVVIGNLACDTLLVSSAALQFGGEFSIVGNPTPSSVFPDSVRRIPLRYTPTDLGFDSDTLLLSLVTLGDAISIRVIIRGEGVSGDAMLVVVPAPDTLFNITMTRCDTPRHFNISLSNPGCKQLHIFDAVMEGPATRNVALTSTSLPIDLRLGAGTSVGVDVTPVDVEITSGLIRIRYQIEGEAIRDTVLYYALQVDYGKRTLAVDKDEVDFGSYRLCTDKDTTITLRNTGCDTLDLTSLVFSGASDETWTYTGPLKLGPGETSTIEYHISPVSAGTRLAGAEITSVSDSTNPIIVSIRSVIIPTDTVRLTIAPVRFPFYVGDTITIQVTPEKAVDISAGLRDIAFTLLYNGDLLTLLPAQTQTLLPGVTHVAGNITTNYPAKQIGQRFFVTGSPYIAFSGALPIMEFKFFVSLTDTTTTALEIADIELNGADATFSKCVLGFTSALSDLELALRCGDSLLREFMRKGDQFSLSTSPIFPDPLTASNGYNATLAFELAEDRHVTLYIYDGSGKAVDVVERPAVKGMNRITIEGQRLPAGAYSYILSDGREYGQGRFVIIK